MIKPIKSWGKKTAALPAQQISNCVIDGSAFRCIVSETVVENRGQFKDYRPGDIWKMLKGTVFQK